VRNPIQIVRDFGPKRALKKQILSAVTIAQREATKRGDPRWGYELPHNDALTAAAVNELLKERPDLMVCSGFKGALMLTKKAAYVGLVSSVTRASIEAAGMIVGPDGLHV